MSDSPQPSKYDQVKKLGIRLECAYKDFFTKSDNLKGRPAPKFINCPQMAWVNLAGEIIDWSGIIFPNTIHERFMKINRLADVQLSSMPEWDVLAHVLSDFVNANGKHVDAESGE